VRFRELTSRFELGQLARGNTSYYFGVVDWSRDAAGWKVAAAGPEQSGTRDLMAIPPKQDIITFKADRALVAAMRGVPNRSAFIRTAILAALENGCVEPVLFDVVLL